MSIIDAGGKAVRHGQYANRKSVNTICGLHPAHRCTTGRSFRSRKDDLEKQRRDAHVAGDHLHSFAPHGWRYVSRALLHEEKQVVSSSRQRLFGHCSTQCLSCRHHVFVSGWADALRRKCSFALERNYSSLVSGRAHVCESLGLEEGIKALDDRSAGGVACLYFDRNLHSFLLFL